MNKHVRVIFISRPWVLTVWGAIFERYYKEWEIRYDAIIRSPISYKGEIERFRNQNKYLFDRFVSSIKEADILIADITGDNPNVMLELGVAIQMNKNILILRREDEKGPILPFNTRGIEIIFYKDFEDLVKKIEDYLRVFLLIKDSNFKSPPESIFHQVPDYFIEAEKERIEKKEIGPDVYRITPLPINLPRMRDVKISVEYRIVNSGDETDWFGFILRSSEENAGRFEPLNGSLLVNARVNGNTAITIYPGTREVFSLATHEPHNQVDYRKLEIHLENNFIEVIGDKDKFIFNKLTLNNFGNLYLTCYRCKVEYRNLRIINIDTITETE